MRLSIAVLFAAVFELSGQPSDHPTYLNPDLPAEQRAADLVSRMTLDEKVLQMQNSAPAIARLNIPAYDWWNEALHGVARAGEATVFPQAIGLAATWDTDLMSRIADTISTEARAKYNEAIRNNNHGRYYGLTFWSPEYQYLSRSALGPRAGDLRRRSLSHRPHRRRFHPRHARRRSALLSKSSRRPSITPCIADPKPRATNSTSSPASAISTTPTCRRSAPPSWKAKPIRVMCAYNAVDGVPACANTDLLVKASSRRVGIQRIRGERLRRDRRYLPRPQVPARCRIGFRRPPSRRARISPAATNIARSPTP